MRTPLLIALVALTPTLLVAKQPDVSPSKAFSAPVRLVDSDPGLFESYGLSLAADGDTLLIGAPASFPNEKIAFYSRSGASWSLVQEITPTDVTMGDFFGESAAMLGDLAVVGTPDQASSSGSAYVFRRTGGTWAQEARLRASDASGGARFGESVSTDGNTIVVGATGVGDRRGAVYVFTRVGGTWTEQARLQAADAARNDTFGGAVAVTEDTLAVGATQSLAAGRGAVYVFSRSGSSWSQQAKLQRSGGAASDFYGAAVALEGNDLAVGAPFVDLAGRDNAGVVEIWRRTGTSWISQGSLTSADVTANAQLGSSLALREGRLAAGAPGDGVAGRALQGSVEVFLRELDGQFAPNSRLVLADGASEDQLGFAVALGANGLIASAPGATVSGQTYAGAVHAFNQLRTTTAIATVAGQPLRIGSAYPVQVSVSASEGIASGSVLVRDDVGGSCTATLNGGSGSCSLTATAVGPRLVQARYGGAVGYAESFATASVQVKPDLRISPDTLPAGQIGAPYAALFDTAGTGATLPLTYSLDAGSLPPGLDLGGNGSLTGTPSAFGSYSFAVRVSDSSPGTLGGPFSESRTYALVIDPPFTTTLVLGTVNTVGDRGTSQLYTATLDVVEPDGEAPLGSYVVSAQRAGQTLSCSAPVTAEGAQSCSLVFPSGAALGDWTVTARFVSDNPDYGNSQASTSHRLESPADPAVSVTPLQALYVAEDTVSARLVVSNSGPDSAPGLRVRGSVDVALIGLAWTCSGSACPAAAGTGAIDLTIGELPSGASVEFVLGGQLGTEVPPAIGYSASVAMDPAAFGRELDAGNNDGSAEALPLLVFASGFED